MLCMLMLQLRDGQDRIHYAWTSLKATVSLLFRRDIYQAPSSVAEIDWIFRCSMIILQQYTEADSNFNCAVVKSSRRVRSARSLLLVHI